MKTVSERRAAKRLKAASAGIAGKPRNVEMTHASVKRLVDNLRLTLAFVEANLPTQARAHPGNGLKRAREALHLTPDTTKKLNEMAMGLSFCVWFIMEHYQGGAMVLVDALEQLTEFGLMERSVEKVTPGHPMYDKVA